MSDKNNPAEQRRETRYVVGNGKTLPIELSNESDSSDKLQGRVIDVSNGGAKIAAEKSLSSDQDYRLQINVPDADVKLEVSGKIRWSRPSGTGEWCAGYLFAEPLTHHTLSHLAESGYLDRRTDARQSIRLPASFREELSTDGQFDVELVDVSDGGLRLEANQSTTLGQRGLVEIADQASGDVIRIPVRPVWQKVVEGRTSIGCCFLNSDGAKLVKRQIPSRDRLREILPPNRTLRMHSWVWIGLAAAVAWCALQLFWKNSL